MSRQERRGGPAQRRRGRQPDGSWQIVADDREAPPPPPAPPREVYIYPPPPAYYAYPPGFYGPYRIFLSFSYVLRGGHVHHGRHCLDGPGFWHRHPRVIRERVFVGPPVHRHYPWRGKPGRR